MRKFAVIITYYDICVNNLFLLVDVEGKSDSPGRFLVLQIRVALVCKSYATNSR